MKCLLGSAVLAAGLFTSSVAPAAPLLPDLEPIASQSRDWVYGHYLDRTTQPGRTLMRLSTAVANLGSGPLEIWGGQVNGSTQEVFQRIYDSNGTSSDRLAGEFVYHANHGHIHFEGFATYSIRTITSGGGVGPIVAGGGKTSFCLVDITRYDSSLTGPQGRGGSSCGQIQGINVGWADVYGAGLPDQWVDVTAVPSGNYWLEVIADPDNQLQESNESNNTVRIQVSYTNPDPVTWTDEITGFSAPGSVDRGSTIDVTVDYEASINRDLAVWVQDSLNNWEIVGTARMGVPPGPGTATVTVPIASDARVGSGYLVVVRLIDVGGIWSDEVAVGYQSIEVLGGGGQDLVDLSNAPSSVNAGATIVVPVDYEATQSRDIALWLQDSVNGWEVVGEGRVTVSSGAGTANVSVTVDAGARQGGDYLWVARNLPVGGGWQSGLDVDYAGASVTSSGGIDQIFAVSAPSSASRGSSFSVTVDYQVSQPRDLAVWLQDSVNNWVELDSARTSVALGGGSRTFNLSFPAGARSGGGHFVVARILTAGGDWTSEIDVAFDEITAN